MIDYPHAFEVAFDALLSPEIEGTHSDRPPDEDPGGDTWYGLARRYHPDLPWPPTKDHAKAIYLRDYWQAAHCDEVLGPVGIFLFDAAVQHAPDDAIRLLQRAVGAEPDGVFGPDTKRRCWGLHPLAICKRLGVLRVHKYISLPNWEANKNGWIGRLFIMYGKAVAYHEAT